jgi:hypothetical protein
MEEQQLAGSARSPDVKEQQELESEISQLREVIDAYEGIKSNIVDFRNLVE